MGQTLSAYLLHFDASSLDSHFCVSKAERIRYLLMTDFDRGDSGAYSRRWCSCLCRAVSHALACISLKIQRVVFLPCGRAVSHVLARISLKSSRIYLQWIMCPIRLPKHILQLQSAADPYLESVASHAWRSRVRFMRLRTARR